MSDLAAAVRVGITGEAYVGPTTTTGPTTSVSSLDAGFIGLGYIDKDGVEENYDDSTEQIVAWQGAVVVRTVHTSSVATLKFTMIETKGKTLELYHKGSSVAVVSAGQWKMLVKGAASDPRSFVLDVLDGSKHIRLYVANGEVTEREPIKYANDGTPIAYGVTITCYADSSGTLLVKFSDDANWGYS